MPHSAGKQVTMGKVDFGKIMVKIKKGLQIICPDHLIFWIDRYDLEPRAS